MSDTDHMTIVELKRAHLFSGARIADEPITDGLPEGWRIIPRQWARGAWDALIQSPGLCGWALGGDMSWTWRWAVKRARAEIQSHVAECRSCVAG